MAKHSGLTKELCLVTKSIRHGETSRITTLFSRQTGKLAVIAKGARKGKKNQTSGNLEPPSLIEAQIYFKPTRSVQILGQTNLLIGYRKIKSDLTLTTYAASILQLVNQIVLDNEPNSELFDIVMKSIENLEKESLDPRLNLWQFIHKMIGALGYEIDLWSCPVCGKSIAEINIMNHLGYESGAIACANCKMDLRNSSGLSGESVQILRQLDRGDEKSLMNLKFSKNAKNEITLALLAYLRFHHPFYGKLSAIELLDLFENTT